MKLKLPSFVRTEEDIWAEYLEAVMAAEIKCAAAMARAQGDKLLDLKIARVVWREEIAKLK